MATTNATAERISKSRTGYGLARMRNHWKKMDGEIESISGELWDSWPVREARKGVAKDPDHAVLAVLAGRMFLAGRESIKPAKTLNRPMSDPPISELKADISRTITSLAQAIYGAVRGEADQSHQAVDLMENLRRQGISQETNSALSQLLVNILTLRKEQIASELAAELGQDDTEEEEIPQSEVDREVEKILRRNQEEGGAA